MKYRLMGKSGLRVSELALGTLTFGTEGWGAEKEESRRVYDRYKEAGGIFIDTSCNYSDGASERFIGEFMREDKDRERLVLATKYTAATRRRDVNATGNNRKNMMDSVHQSLERLGTDYIDMLWVHARDFTTPIEEVMRGLDDLVTQGKVLYVGFSDVPAWEVSRANMLAEMRGWTAFVGLQIQYSLLNRTAERELIPMAKALDITVTPWDILGSGVLTGKYNHDAASEGRAATFGNVSERDLGIAAVVVDLASKLGRTPAQVALAWIRQKTGVIVPIVGARTLAQLDDNLACLDLELSAEVMQVLDDASVVELGFPHDLLREQFPPGRIINHRD